jgi:hypothetical protein
MANYQGPQPALASIAKPSLVADAQPDPVKREDVTATPELTPAVASEPATAMGVDPQKIAAALVPPASDMMLRADPAKIEEAALTILTARVADLPTVATPVSVRTDPPSVGNAAAARPMMVAKVADVSTIAPPAVVRSGPPSARIARPTMVAKVVMKTRALPIRPSGKKYVLVGYPLTVLNGSGQAVATERMRLLLARHGWARPRFDTFVQPIRRDTMLVYSESNFIPALALARTLRMPIHLVSCGRRCNRLQLVVGSDFLKSSLADAAHGLRRS